MRQGGRGIPVPTGKHLKISIGGWVMGSSVYSMDEALHKSATHGENSLTRLCWARRCRGPFGFAQGRLFDFAGASLREVPAPLRMTAWTGFVVALRELQGSLPGSFRAFR